MSREEIIARHRRETKELMARAADMKKQVPKSDKKNRKEVMKKIEEMEAQLKAKQQQELSEAAAGSESSIDSREYHDTQDEESEGQDGGLTPAQLLAQLALEEQGQEKEKQPDNQEQAVPAPAGPKKKRNRRKEKLAQRNQSIKDMQQEAREEADVQPDLRQIELESLAQICKLRGLEQYDIKPDGHCLFASISDQLQVRHGDTQSIQVLRSKAANYIRENPDTFGPFLFDETTLQMREIEPYCQELESTAVWGGDMEILALANVFDCCISVLFSGRAEHKVNVDGAKSELKLVYYKHSFGLGEHYNSLRDAQE